MPRQTETRKTNLLVRIIRDDDGDLKSDHQDWHLVDPGNPQGDATLCTGEFFGGGESACEFVTKRNRE